MNGLPIGELSTEQLLRAQAAAQAALSKRQRERLLFSLFPDEGPLRRALYPKHTEFFAAGAKHNERAFIAANRVGKSYAVGYEDVLHLIGWYPPWWVGRRFDRPIISWASGEDAKAVRESLQPKLIGEMADPGTGLIPKANLVNVFARTGVTGSADFAVISHSSGGTSRLVFKSYDQGRESFASSEVDVLLLDEEPPLDVYTEGLTRTMSTIPGQPNGMIIAAFTPLDGISETVEQFLPGGALPETEAARLAAWGW